MMMCSAGSSGFAATSLADSASAIRRTCCVAPSTSFLSDSAVTSPRTTWKTSLSPTSAWRPSPLLPARRIPIVSGERFLASRRASAPLMPGSFCAEMITLIGVSPSVVNASLPLVAQCTVYRSSKPELSESRALCSLCSNNTCVLNWSSGTSAPPMPYVEYRKRSLLQRSICRGFSSNVGSRRQMFESVTRRTIKVQGASRLGRRERGGQAWPRAATSCCSWAIASSMVMTSCFFEPRRRTATLRFSISRWPMANSTGTLATLCSRTL